MANGGPGQPWPVSRSYHSAVSLYDSDSNPSNPTLMVMWGLGGGDEILNDWWLFGVNAQHWRKVRQSVSSTSFCSKIILQRSAQLAYMDTVMSSNYTIQQYLCGHCLVENAYRVSRFLLKVCRQTMYVTRMKMMVANL